MFPLTQLLSRLALRPSVRQLSRLPTALPPLLGSLQYLLTSPLHRKELLLLCCLRRLHTTVLRRLPSQAVPQISRTAQHRAPKLSPLPWRFRRVLSHLPRLTAHRLNLSAVAQWRRSRALPSPRRRLRLRPSRSTAHLRSRLLAVDQRLQTALKRKLYHMDTTSERVLTHRPDPLLS